MTMLYFACWLQQGCKAGAPSCGSFAERSQSHEGIQVFFLGPRALGPFSGSQEKSLYKRLLVTPCTRL